MFLACVSLGVKTSSKEFGNGAEDSEQRAATRSSGLGWFVLPEELAKDSTVMI